MSKVFILLKNGRRAAVSLEGQRDLDNLLKRSKCIALCHMSRARGFTALRTEAAYFKSAFGKASETHLVSKPINELHSFTARILRQSKSSKEALERLNNSRIKYPARMFELQKKSTTKIAKILFFETFRNLL